MKEVSDDVPVRLLELMELSISEVAKGFETVQQGVVAFHWRRSQRTDN